MRVLLFSPIRQRPDILEPVLRSHAALKGISHLLYVDDNDESASSDALRLHAKNLSGIASVVYWPSGDKPEYSGHAWNKQSISRIASIREWALQNFVRETDYDAILMVDSDLVLNPDMLSSMIEASDGRQVVSEVFWSKWDTAGSPALPNVWDSQPYQFDGAESILRLRFPSRFEPVGGLGACTLIPRYAVEHGASYMPIPSLPYEGEDRHFCVRCQAAGIELLADTAHPPFHIYRQEQLGEAVAWQAAGCPPQYFADVWLDAEWEKTIREWDGGNKPAISRRIAVCLPGEWAHSMFNSHWEQCYTAMLKAGHMVDVYRSYSSNVFHTRAELAEAVMKSPFPLDYVLWVDDDQLLAPEALAHMLQQMEQHPEADLLSAWTVIQPDVIEVPAKVSCGRMVDGLERPLTAESLASADLQEIDWTGFPVVLMRPRALTLAARECNPFAMMPDSRMITGSKGEDVGFCHRLKAAGGRMYCDPRIYVPHLKLRALQPDWSALVKAREEAVKALAA